MLGEEEKFVNHEPKVSDLHIFFQICKLIFWFTDTIHDRFLTNQGACSTVKPVLSGHSR